MIVRIGRRRFLAGLGAAAAAWPLTARAQQQSGNVRTIGLLSTDKTSMRPMLDAFKQRLHELGWIDGQTIVVDDRWSEGSPERAAEFAAEFVRLKVDVIVTSGIAAAIVKRTTSEIPIVLAAANDPVGGGLVKSLARPGGNVTGMSNEAADLAGKRLELLREVAPNLRKLAVLVDAGFAQSALEMSEVQAAARKFGLDLVPIEIRQPQDIVPAFAALKRPVDALYVVGDSLLNTNMTSIDRLALGARLPSVFNTQSFVRAGGLMSYGPNIADQYRHAADYVDKILRGAKPGDLPVEQPTKFELVINLKTAKALGLTVPTALVATADEVIE